MTFVAKTVVEEKKNGDKNYGHNSYFQKIKELLKDKYGSEMDFIWGSTDQGRASHIQVLLLAEVLTELRELNEVLRKNRE